MTPKVFGQRVYNLRMAKGWTQDMLADRAGMSVRTIQKIEAYEMEHPPVDTVSKLLVAFHCTWDELLGAPKAVIAAASMPVMPKFPHKK